MGQGRCGHVDGRGAGAITASPVGWLGTSSPPLTPAVRWRCGHVRLGALSLSVNTCTGARAPRTTSEAVGACVRGPHVWGQPFGRKRRCKEGGGRELRTTCKRCCVLPACQRERPPKPNPTPPRTGWPRRIRPPQMGRRGGNTRAAPPAYAARARSPPHLKQGKQQRAAVRALQTPAEKCTGPLRRVGNRALRTGPKQQQQTTGALPAAAEASDARTLPQPGGQVGRMNITTTASVQGRVVRVQNNYASRGRGGARSRQGAALCASARQQGATQGRAHVALACS